MIVSFFAEHPYRHLLDTLKEGKIKYFNPQKLNDSRYGEFMFRPLNSRKLLHTYAYMYVYKTFSEFSLRNVIVLSLHDVEFLGNISIIQQDILLYRLVNISLEETW